MIKPDLLKTPFVVPRFPSLPCPKCGASVLLDKKDRLWGQTSESAFAMDMGGNDPDYYQAVGSILLKCSNASCNEPLVCTGMITNKESESWDGTRQFEFQINPHFFMPPLRIISIPENLPQAISSPLMDSLSLFWMNPAYSGNALRILVEALMDHERIVKSYRNNKKQRKMYTLHQRIEFYQSKKPNLGAKLLAIKWIGNNGSHLSGLTRDQVWKAFQIVEHVLEEIFEKKTKSLENLVSHINRKRGRI